MRRWDILLFVCCNPACKTARRQQTQATWRKKNPGYATAYRIDQRHNNQAAEPEPLRVPAPLNQLPWDLAKDQFGGKGAARDVLSTHKKQGTLFLQSRRHK